MNLLLIINQNVLIITSKKSTFLKCIFFRKLTQLTRTLDSTRLIDVVFGSNGPISSPLDIVNFLDIIGVNTYPGWYNNLGVLETVEDELEQVIGSWHKQHQNKTIISRGLSTHKRNYFFQWKICRSKSRALRTMW